MPSEICSVFIELLPEFGWSIDNKAVYGPGSILQGYVKLKTIYPLPIKTVRIAFYADEAMITGSIMTAKHTLFSTQTTLWDSTQDKSLLSNHLPFIIQMPMIQFPPSLKARIYQCNYQLVAIVDTSCNTAIKRKIPVRCMPFIQTNRLTTPLILSTKDSLLFVQLKMTAAEFVPGDIIPLNLHVRYHLDPKQQKRRSRCVVVRLQIIQTISVKIFDNVSDYQQIVASHKSSILTSDDDNDNADDENHLELQVPTDLPSSCDYGNMVNISYRLQVSIEQRGPLGGIWNDIVQFKDLPIKIGTLTYGVQPSRQLKYYSQYKVVDNKVTGVPYPTFMKFIEHDDVLPPYDSVRLPSYE
ncbi:hypothetical protein G6F57_005886 [Rhizopus arrhizus]|uniref:Arrestin C-terminal-like domain-containing protein n=1 Tax=Rhizopus oryzae TaxID=64495 RepID=A0A9P6X2P4_RHIOR|nr:hypothetical protein G6F23_008115 [Rhizopus arrhizus]KAG1410710.1 hypothetical protein G6F58_008961 [Rhizopus delemar]KAG0758637.1 hypothetical protein G6F24_009660 [Rhizopus arrhizus]KAG0784865.1 hypothetical protein G6F21_009634 [Rhizopus arrhizus]KAG0790167.1 hypothetical protein G6F22_006487 [Rhizopus arrhizus]